MSTIETTTPLAAQKSAPALAKRDSATEKQWKPSAIASDIVTLGAGTALAATFNTLLIFLIPRLLTVEQYGYWRLFLLYAGYVGFLHLGFADGALLRWAGLPFHAIQHEIGPALKFIVLQSFTLIVSGCVIIEVLPGLSIHVRHACEGVLFFGLIANSVTLLQYSLQGARIFRPVAVVSALPAGSFVVLAFLWSFWKTPTAIELMVMYGVAWTAALFYLWTRVNPKMGRSSVWTLGRTLTALGWPVVLANTGFGLMVSTDRLVVSSALPITEFAQYSLAASTMFVPITAIAAVSRVFFSHAAAVEHDDRPKIYSHMSRFLLISWSLLLPYFFVLEAFITHFLPEYAPGLPVAGVLLVSVVFLAGVQILHMSYFYLNGRQKEFLWLTLGALLTGILVAFILTRTHSLVAVAIGQVGALALWWLLNEWKLRKATGQSPKDWLRAGCVGLWSVASYALAFHSCQKVSLRIALYYALVATALWVACSDEIRLGWRIVRSHI